MPARKYFMKIITTPSVSFADSSLPEGAESARNIRAEKAQCVGDAAHSIPILTNQYFYFPTTRGNSPCLSSRFKPQITRRAASPAIP